MEKMDRTDEQLLETIADLHGIPEGSFNIRKNGKLLARNSDTDIEIVSKTDKDGIDIIVKPNVKNKSVHIPVLLTVGDFQDTVYNDFFIGENSDVTIVAGCGIHNDTCGNAEHDGVHTFYVGKNAKVRYIERHYANGNGTGKKVFDPVTKIWLKENSQFILESTQLGGVTYTDRKTYATVGKNAQLLVKEKILTDGEEKAITDFKVKLTGKNSRADIVSRSVAKGKSLQQFKSDMIGKNECFGHVEWRRHRAGRRAYHFHAEDRRRQPRGEPGARSRRRKDRGRAVAEIDEPGSYRAGSGGRRHQRFPELININAIIVE